MSLRQQVFRGGAYLAVRHGLGTVINIVGVVLLTRAIGTTQYGVFAAALSFFTVLHFISRGVGVFLVRREQENTREIADKSASLLLVLSVGVTLIGAATLPMLIAWTKLPGLGRFTLALYAVLPLAYVAQVPLAQLERALEYRKLAIVELLAHALLYIVAIPLGYLGYGAWAPVAGWWVYQISVSTFYHRLARYIPTWRWDPSLAREATSYGAGYTGSLWLFSLRRLVNPLVVGRYLGAEAVAIVAVTTQIATQLSFVAAATARLTPAAFARVQFEAQKLGRAITDGMSLQVVAVGPFLLLFAWLSGFLVSPALGQAWTPITMIYPFIAVAQLAVAVFALHTAALFVLRRNWDVGIFNACHTGILALGALLLVPRFGLIGYGFAELCTVLAVVVLHVFTLRRVGAPDYSRAGPLMVAFALGLFWHYIGPWSLVGLVLVTVLLRPWRELSHMFDAVRGIAGEA